MRRTSVLTKFGVTSLVVIAVLGVSLGALLQGVLRHRTLDDARRTAVVAAELGVKPLLEPADLTRNFVPLPPERLAALDRGLANRLADSDIVRLKVWNASHWIVYSDHDPLIGQWFASDDLLEGALRGEVTSEVTVLSRPEELEERDFGQLLAVYVPLRAADGRFTDDPDDPVVGAVEIYLPYLPIAATMRRDTTILYVALAVGLGLLYGALFRLVQSASRRLRRQAAQNRHQALHDALTGLPNRSLFRDRLERARLAAGRHGTGVAVLLLDLDRFKEVNDTLGHHCGDLLLEQIGPRLSTRLRESDSIARLGGDEFAVLAPDVATVADAANLASDLLQALETPFPVDDLDLDVRASIGIALYPDHGDDADALLQHADVAMYLAKTAHTGYEVYTPDRDHYSPENLVLASGFRRAIERGELELHYQPKLDLRSRGVAGVEALVRWRHPQRGLLDPGEFLPVVEPTELIKPLTLWVLETALAQCHRWLERGRELAVSVNLSARSLHDMRLPGEVQERLVRYGVPARLLTLELTETALLDNPARARMILTRLAGIGVRISIDDFGTGYASLAYLKQLPVDELKIDRSFVTHMSRPGEDAVIVQFSTDLARNLGLQVVAEGVETPDVLTRLAELDCDQIQGHFVSRPLPIEELDLWLADFDRQLRRGRTFTGATSTGGTDA